MVTEFRYPAKITYGINSYEQLRNLVDYSWGMSIPERAVVFVDNHDLQRDSNIGPGMRLITTHAFILLLLLFFASLSPKQHCWLTAKKHVLFSFHLIFMFNQTINTDVYK